MTDEVRQIEQESLAAYMRVMSPTLPQPRHTVMLIEALEAVERGDLDRLMVFMPPRHQKSVTVSEHLPPWYLGRNPDRRIILSSYAAELAHSFSAKARNQFDDARYPFMLSLRDDSSAKHAWDIDCHRGGMIAAGIGGPITGKGGNLAIIDDPFKNREEAESQTIRDKVWDWYTSTLYTRLEQPNAVILCMCMVGDTRVLMQDGSERLLRDIRPGDRIATYDDGKVSVSAVRNWADQGPDNVYEIRMKSGITVRANARHPFLVKTDRGTTWQRTASLTRGSVILRVIGANGGASSAQRKDATSPPNAGAYACPTTARNDGRRGIGPLLRALRSGVGIAYGGTTGLTRKSTTACSLNRAGFARFVVSRLFPAATPAHIGPTNSVLTTTTTPEQSEDSSVTTVTSPSDTARAKPSCSPQLHTCEIIEDTVLEVVAAGVEHVFDIEVERTANFIANGLVSHNTRWHEDDLAGRLLNASGEFRDNWHVISFPAIDEHGVELWPEKFDYSRIKANIGSRDWNALYLQNPIPSDGIFFRKFWLRYFTASEDRYLLGNKTVNARACRIFSTVDLAFTAKETSDYTCISTWAQTPENDLLLLAVTRRRMESTETIQALHETFDTWRPSYILIEHASFVSHIISDARRSGLPIREVVPDKDKQTRALPAAARMETGTVYFRANSPETDDVTSEVLAFPNGVHDDFVDTLAYAALEVLKRPVKQDPFEGLPAMIAN